MSADIRVVDVETAVFPPNKQLEVTLEFSKSPVVYDHIFFIDFNSKGECMLGSSNISGTFWEGTTLLFDNAKSLQEFNYRGYYIYSTASDGKFLNDNTIVIAEDTAVLSVIRVNEDFNLQPINYFRHFEIIPQVAVWNNSSNVLTCSGRSVSILDVNDVERKKLYNFSNYHLEFINSVDTLKTDLNLFVTGANDKSCCLWDVRLDSPPTVIYANEFSSITNVAWNQSDTNYIVCGTEAGDVYLVDRREPKEFVSVLHCFDSKIHRLSFNNSSQFGVCGDTKDVLIINSENKTLELVYKNQNQNGFVRGLTWQDQTLYSCGFGKGVDCHQIK